jgi:hypothetical protein
LALRRRSLAESSVQARTAGIVIVVVFLFISRLFAFGHSPGKHDGCNTGQRTSQNPKNTSAARDEFSQAIATFIARCGGLDAATVKL